MTSFSYLKMQQMHNKTYSPDNEAAGYPQRPAVKTQNTSSGVLEFRIKMLSVVGGKSQHGAAQPLTQQSDARGPFLTGWSVKI